MHYSDLHSEIARSSECNKKYCMFKNENFLFHLQKFEGRKLRIIETKNLWCHRNRHLIGGRLLSYFCAHSVNGRDRCGGSALGRCEEEGAHRSLLHVRWWVVMFLVFISLFKHAFVVSSNMIQVAGRDHSNDMRHVCLYLLFMLGRWNCSFCFMLNIQSSFTWMWGDVHLSHNFM